MIPIEKPNSFLFTIHLVNVLSEISTNALAQKKVADVIQIAEKKLYEFEQIYNIISNV